MDSDVISIKAKLTLYTTENGGRKTGIASHYRPNHVLEYLPNSNQFSSSYVGEIEFDKGFIYPGETEKVLVHFLKHQKIEAFITKGRVWWIHEGAKKVGKMELIEEIKK